MSDTLRSTHDELAHLPDILKQTGLDDASFVDLAERFEAMPPQNREDVIHEAAERVREGSVVEHFGVEDTGAAFVIAQLNILQELDAIRINHSDRIEQ